MISKFLLCLGASPFLFASLLAQSSTPSTPMPSPAPAPLHSAVFDWDKLPVTPTKVGVRRAVFDGPTATVDKAHCHATVLNPGEQSGEPRRHLVDEIIIIREGTVEAFADGEKHLAPAGAVIFFASGAVTALRNVGEGPATYYVISYTTPLTPKS